MFLTALVLASKQKEVPKTKLLSKKKSFPRSLSLINFQSTRATLCLWAAAEQEKQKYKNQEKINSNKDEIGAKLAKAEEYRIVCENSKIGYYNAFKIQDEERDFHANIKRLELAGMWDEIIEMLKRNELPDDFEGQKDWIELGTKYRRLVEPLDIANC